jgi:hypothetical protein
MCFRIQLKSKVCPHILHFRLVADIQISQFRYHCTNQRPDALHFRHELLLTRKRVYHLRFAVSEKKKAIVSTKPERIVVIQLTMHGTRESDKPAYVNGMCFQAPIKSKMCLYSRISKSSRIPNISVTYLYASSMLNLVGIASFDLTRLQKGRQDRCDWLGCTIVKRNNYNGERYQLDLNFVDKTDSYSCKAISNHHSAHGNANHNNVH